MNEIVGADFGREEWMGVNRLHWIWVCILMAATLFATVVRSDTATPAPEPHDAANAVSISVTVREGDVYIDDRRSTKSGDASDPSLSPNRTQIVFVRKVTPSTEEGVCSGTQIWLFDLTKAAAASVLAEKAADDPEDNLTGFFQSPDFTRRHESVFHV